MIHNSIIVLLVKGKMPGKMYYKQWCNYSLFTGENAAEIMGYFFLFTGNIDGKLKNIFSLFTEENTW